MLKFALQDLLSGLELFESLKELTQNTLQVITQHWKKLKLLLLHDWVLAEIQTYVDTLFQNRACNLNVLRNGHIQMLDNFETGLCQI